MNGRSATSLGVSRESRRTLYRRSKRVLMGLLATRWPTRRPALERAVRGLLRDRPRNYLARVTGDRGFALAAAAALVASVTATAVPPVDCSDVVAGTGGFVINGDDPDDRSGYSVSGAGDVNGDGLADLIVGAPFADPGGNAYAGKSYVVFGKAGTAPVNLSDVTAGTGGFVIDGINPNDRSGRSVSDAGDVNGDGLADLIVGAFRADPGGDLDAGESYVVFGKAGTAPVNLSDVAAGTGGFVINGIDPDDQSGASVAGAGDVNGDGLADLIVGARGPNDHAGAGYVVFGKADTAPVILANVVAGTGGFVINGIDPDDDAGKSVAGAGDVNGDGLADLIVGAYRAEGGSSNAGETYVVFGKADTAPVNLSNVAAGTGGYVINGIDPDDRSGGSVSGAGDVNGDGRVDLILGAPQADPGGISGAGESYVVYGKTGTAPVNLADVVAGTGGFVINGIDQFDFSGWSVSGAGDVNGDGLADLIVGAVNGSPGGNFAGESYVVFGPSCPWDCANGDGQVGIVDFLALLQGWGAAGFCDFNGGGIGVVDFLAQLQHWGTCP